MEEEFGGEDISSDVSVEMSIETNLDTIDDFGGDLASAEGVDLSSDVNIDTVSDTDASIDTTEEVIDLNSYDSKDSTSPSTAQRIMAGGMAGLASIGGYHHVENLNDQYVDMPTTEIHQEAPEHILQHNEEWRQVTEHFEQTGEAILTPEMMERYRIDVPHTDTNPSASEIAGEIGDLIREGGPVEEHEGIVDEVDTNDE